MFWLPFANLLTSCKSKENDHPHVSHFRSLLACQLTEQANDHTNKTRRNKTNREKTKHKTRQDKRQNVFGDYRSRTNGPTAAATPRVTYLIDCFQKRDGSFSKAGGQLGHAFHLGGAFALPRGQHILHLVVRKTFRSYAVPFHGVPSDVVVVVVAVEYNRNDRPRQREKDSKK